MDTIKLVIQLYNDYFGQGYLSWVFLGCMVYLWVCEKEKTRRFYLLYVSISVLIVFFCPIFTYLAVRTIFDQETYYRILWLVPIYPVIAYTATKVITDQRRKVVQALVIIITIGIIVLTGSDTYKNPTFTKAENVYHVPKEVVELCDMIQVEDEWTCVVVPKELLESIRQYGSHVRLPYGREMLIERWGFVHPLYDAMEAEVIDALELAELAREYTCQYVVLEQGDTMTEGLEEYDYEVVGRIEQYVVYQDSVMEERQSD